MKRYLSILLIVITVFMLTACGSTEIKNGKTFTESDFEITLTNDFVKKELSGIKYYYEDSTNGILAIINVESKQLFENAGIAFPDDAKSYAEFVVKANGLGVEVNTYKNVDYAQFTYNRSVSGTEYSFYAVTFRSGDNCWLVQFRCNSAKYNEFVSQFKAWSETVKFK